MKSYVVIRQEDKGSLPQFLPIGCTLTLIGVDTEGKQVYEYNRSVSDAFGLIRSIVGASVSNAEPVLKQKFEPESQAPVEPKVESKGAQVPPLPKCLAPGHHFGT